MSFPELIPRMLGARKGFSGRLAFLSLPSSEGSQELLPRGRVHTSCSHFQQIKSHPWVPGAPTRATSTYPDPGAIASLNYPPHLSWPIDYFTRPNSQLFHFCGTATQLGKFLTSHLVLRKGTPLSQSLRRFKAAKLYFDLRCFTKRCAGAPAECGSPAPTSSP